MWDVGGKLVRAAAPGDSQHTARPLLPAPRDNIVTMDTRSLSWQGCISIAIHQFLCLFCHRQLTSSEDQWSPCKIFTCEPSPHLPTLLRQAVRAFVSNNDLKKSYGEHESIHSLLCIHHERRNVFWTDQQLVIRIDPIASQLNAESALTGIAANTSLHDVSRYQQYQKFFYF